MERSIIKVAEHLEDGTIDLSKARKLLSNLLGYSGTQRTLSINNVSKMLKEVSKETWVATQGNEQGFEEWYSNRNKLNINDSDY